MATKTAKTVKAPKTSAKAKTAKTSETVTAAEPLTEQTDVSAQAAGLDQAPVAPGLGQPLDQLGDLSAQGTGADLTDAEVPAFLRKSHGIEEAVPLPPAPKAPEQIVAEGIIEQYPLLAAIDNEALKAEVIRAIHAGIIAAGGLGKAGKPKVERKPRQPRAEGPNKREQAAALLTRKEGCTTRDILDLTGWPSVSVPQLAKASGLTLRKDTSGKVTVYFGEKPEAKAV